MSSDKPLVRTDDPLSPPLTDEELRRFRAEVLAGIDRIAGMGGVENYFDDEDEDRERGSG